MLPMGHYGPRVPRGSSGHDGNGGLARGDMRTRLRRSIDAAGAAGGLALSVGIIGVVVWTGAAGADWDGTSHAEAVCPTSSLPPSISSTPPSPVVPPSTTSPAPSTTPTSTTSSQPPSSSQSSEPCASSSSAPSSSGQAGTTSRTKPRPTSSATRVDNGGDNGGGNVTTTTTPPAGTNGGGYPGAPGLPTVPGGEVPDAGPLPGDGQLPEDAAPPVATQVPEFGLLGPDPKALAGQQEMSPGEARALPDQTAPRAPELIAVGLLAIVVGVLARMLAPRPGKHRKAG